jgi:transglutaminase-like putative cysteine protease
MPVVTIRHATVYRYAAPVTFGDHRLMFRPRDSHDLRLLETGLQISPSASVRWLHDVFGNSIAVASFVEPATELRLVSTIRLEHFPAAALEFPVEPYAKRHPFSYSTVEVPDLGRTIEQHYPDPDHTGRRVGPALHHCTRRDGHPGPAGRHDRRHRRVVSLRGARGGRHADARRDPRPRRRHVPRFRALHDGSREESGLRGAFRLRISLRRSGGRRRRDARLGADLPAGGGWVELDPTNALVGGQKLVRVAVARDPSQAIPVAGTWTGAPSDFLGMSVDVETIAEGG